MPTKRSKTGGLAVLPTAGRNTQVASSPAESGNPGLAGTTSSRAKAGANGYLCALERNQNGKYNVRVRAVFGPKGREVDGGRAAEDARNGQAGWTLPVFFLASSFNAAMKKLEESLQHLQKNEERLRFWGVERSDDPNLAGELLQEFGLWLDRRREFPRKIAELGVPRERRVTASMLAPVRRVLADSLAQERPEGRPALASD